MTIAWHGLCLKMLESVLCYVVLNAYMNEQLCMYHMVRTVLEGCIG